MHYNIYGFAEIIRFGVPMFLMISGALLLNKSIELKLFFRKKFKRICYPFIFYLIIHLILMNTKYVDIFRYNWYFWMILGVYLSIPIINKFIENALTKEIEYYLLIFIATSVVYQILYFFNISHFINLNFFIIPTSYLILGYYLSKKEFSIKPNTIVTICLILFCITTIIKIWGAWEIIPKILTEDYSANQTTILSSWLDINILEIIQVSSLFLLVKNIYDSKKGIYSRICNILKKKFIKKFIVSVSMASYGMYLMNATIMHVWVDNIKIWHLSGTQICVCIIGFTLLIFFVSWIIVLIFSKIPYINKISGYS